MIEEMIDHYSDDETRRRFEAALKDARIAGPKPNQSLTPKRFQKQRKKRRRNAR